MHYPPLIYLKQIPDQQTMVPDLREILKLYRIHTGAASAAVPTLAVLSGGANLGTGSLVFVMALFHHAWAFSLNEIGDLEIDRRSDDLSGKPLVSGSIGIPTAWILSSFALLISLVTVIIISIINGTSPVVPLFLITVATASGIVYDLGGKKFPSDILVSTWILFIILAGWFATGPGAEVPLGVIAVSIMAPLHILFNNSVEGGIKDVENDRRTGARTMAVVLGCRKRDRSTVLSSAFYSWSILLRAAFVVSASILGYLIYLKVEPDPVYLVAALVAPILVFTHSLIFIKRSNRMERGSLIRVFSLHEILSFALSCFIIAPLVGWIETAVIFLVSALWFLVFNRLIYGTRMQPGV
jgi:4-hydroxybenzoate polyprenyltransferase